MGRIVTRSLSNIVATLAMILILAGISSAQSQIPAAQTSKFGTPIGQIPIPNATIVPQNNVDAVTYVVTSKVSTLGGYPKLVDQIQATLPGAKVGGTYYDFQTNAAMANRVAYFEDGSDKYLQVVWMSSSDATRDAATRIPGFTSARGTKYNYLDVNDPENPSVGITSWAKIEVDRAGWPSIAQFDDGSVGTASHVPISFYKNGSIGDELFSKFPVSTIADSTLWPRIAIDGKNNVHMVYNRTPPGGRAQVAYRRSTDRGETWGAELFFTGASATNPSSVTAALPDGAGGDTYAIAARGANVVVAYGDGPLRVLARRSTDYGATWTDNTVGLRLVFDANHTFIDSTEYRAGGIDSIILHSDTVVAPSMHMDVILDSKGVAHYAVGQCLTYITTKGLKDNSVAGSRAGTIFSVVGDQFYEGLGVSYFREGDTVSYNIGRMGGEYWDGKGAIVSRRSYSGVARYPQLGITDDDNLHLVFTGVKTGDTKAMQIDLTPGNATSAPDTLFDVDGLYGHIYGMYRPANSMVWSPALSLTPDGVNCIFGTLCDKVINNRMYVAYSASAVPGDRVTNVETPVTEAEIYVMAFDNTKLGIVNSVSEEASELDASVSIAPNPASEQAIIKIHSVTDGKFTVSVVSSVGQVISKTSSPSTNGEWSVVIPTSNLSNGAYFVVVEQNGVRTTRTISVLH
ncbi:MAG: T9SS type A sorting domain-containing protein [Ignavibacteria bacterium]|nr:T9SS type A sorting domain-containing protein [Ignavibacteria bacterium]